MQRAMVWPIRSLKVLLVGITTCGLGWFWLAFYLYVEWRRERQRPPHARQTGANNPVGLTMPGAGFEPATSCL